MRLRQLLSVAALSTLLVAASGCANEAPPVSEKVQEYYDANKEMRPLEVAVTPSVAIIGDSYVAGSSEGGAKSANWVKVAQSTINTTEPALLTAAGAGGAGYVQVGPAGTRFIDNVPRAVTPETDVIVFFGSRNDAPHKPADVAAAATEAFAAARAIAPEAKLLVIGPAWVDANPPAKVVAINEALGEAAKANGGEFVDAIVEGWFNGERGSLIGGDGVHPTDQGHAYMAEVIAPRIAALIG